MSSFEDSTTPEASVSGSDAATAAPNASASKEIQALPRPSELTSGAIPITTQEIRGEVRITFQDDDVWAEVVDTLEPQGTTGSVQFDHAKVSRIILDNSEKLQVIKGLSEFVLWQHIVAVLRSKPFFYIMERGYIIGRDDAAAAAHDANNARNIGNRNVS